MNQDQAIMCMYGYVCVCALNCRGMRLCVQYYSCNITAAAVFIVF